MNQIIDAVVLYRLSGFRVAANDRRPVNRNGQFRFQCFDLQLSQILRLFIMITKAGVMMQFVFFDQSLPLAGDITCRNVMIATQPFNRFRKLIHVQSAFDIHARGHVLGHRQIVNRRQMKDRSGFAARLRQFFWRQS